jgi:hypothetical protein
MLEEEVPASSKGRQGTAPRGGAGWYLFFQHVPVQLYNINLQIQANHSTNHSIAFPMNGPMECLKKLLCLNEKYYPQVTFLGLQDEWMKKAGKYKYFYEMDTDIAYDWLRVWVDVNHPSFQKLHH